MELDKLLLPLLAETLAEHPNAEVVPGDALKSDLAALMRERCPGHEIPGLREPCPIT